MSIWKVQTALVIRRLFICEFAHSHLKIGPKWQYSSQKWANSRFAVQNEGTYLPRITRKSCIWFCQFKHFLTIFSSKNIPLWCYGFFCNDLWMTTRVWRHYRRLKEILSCHKTYQQRSILLEPAVKFRVNHIKYICQFIFHS
jgi:hypothetical protein